VDSIFALADPPRQAATAYIGEMVSIHCGNPIAPKESLDWHYKSSQSVRGKLISSGGYNANGDFGGRVELNGSSLIINNVNVNDSGTFTCIEGNGQGPQYHTDLTVRGKFRQ